MLAIGVALMAKPRILLLDKPSAGLSVCLVSILRQVILSMKARGMTMAFVEQNASLSPTTADRGYVIQNGVVATSGPVDKLKKDEAVNVTICSER